jgi:hypothetical protein
MEDRAGSMPTGSRSKRSVHAAPSGSGVSPIFLIVSRPSNVLCRNRTGK